MALPSASPPPGWGARGMDGLLDSFPRGGLSEIVGPRSSGGGSLLLAVLARAAAAGGRVALVDGADALDVRSAHAAGVDLRDLLWVRCAGQWRKAWSAADLLARCAGFAVVALDLGGVDPGRRDPGAAVRCIRLQRAVERSATTLVLHAPYHLAGHAAALVVAVRRVTPRWVGLPRPTRLAGLVSEVRVVRLRARPMGPREADGGSAPPVRPDGTAGWLVEWRL